MLNSVRLIFRVLHRRTNIWLAGHPWLHDLLNATGSLKSGSEAIARGVAIGLFIGLTPTVGFQTILMITACILFSGNFPVAFTTSFVSNPLTVAPFYWGFHELGEAVFTVFPLLLTPDNGGIIRGVVDEILFTGLGSLLIATPVSVGAYMLTRIVLTKISLRRNRRQAGTPGSSVATGGEWQHHD